MNLIFDKQKDVFNCWFDKSVTYMPTITTLTIAAYVLYREYALESNTVPLQPKTFANLLKVKVKEEENFKTVLFQYKKHPQIIGLSFSLNLFQKKGINDKDYNSCKSYLENCLVR